jgi:SnoaL-like protein
MLRRGHRGYCFSMMRARDTAPAISPERIGLVYRAADALNQRDLDSFLAICDPAIEFTSHLVKLDGGGDYSGHDGVRAWWLRVLAFSPEFRMEVEEVRDPGDITVARIRAHCHDWQSDGPAEQIEWNVIKWRETKAIWWFVVLDEAEALEAAGLRE